MEDRVKQYKMGLTGLANKRNTFKVLLGKDLLPFF